MNHWPTTGAAKVRDSATTGSSGTVPLPLLFRSPLFRARALGMRDGRDLAPGWTWYYLALVADGGGVLVCSSPRFGPWGSMCQRTDRTDSLIIISYTITNMIPYSRKGHFKMNAFVLSIENYSVYFLKGELYLNPKTYLTP